MRKWILLWLSLVAASAGADTATTSFNVTASIAKTCEVSATDLAFGAFNPVAGSDLDSTSVITVHCTASTTYRVGLNKGINGSSVTDRLMSNGSGGTLLYFLYSDSGRTTNWDATGVAGTGNGAHQDLTVYGRIPGGSNASAPPGSYTDTVTVTVTY